MIITGKTHVYGDNIDTDRIIPGKYTKTLNLQDLADHVLEDLDPEFRSRVKQGDIIVGGSNFGCGSSREQAPLALKKAGISAVVAQSFARIFFRNAINIGLPVIEVKDHSITMNDEVEVDLQNGQVTNLSTNEVYEGTQIPEVMVKILNEGGLVPYLKEYKSYS
ncbi:3-isopropylmalate/(R)-2-methylmalate dehydratase small subunit [Cytobacillus horneckiae]|uniref:3-isopropylmalate dehydratase small subunit n=1 Tax=Cytobacillus horneckiae TaxID=549687 RepID=A0A2N0ZFR5_9BACI|nr:3-isopropylmalate dehydratase small subunit [Cytobacillus horneckiae]MBN6885105.1 3-isopropylmalate dehydratase small subunit [Cytobacillus horneckiae]MCM3179139.1 3-isopropylmalate dehydratase small subunit [Cytobacillus horneckiae]MEC1154363.1 3-isopropylmalate dehydratase small subunit [Cytobacillus horneckiae]MED2937699.1 3-isopropylmalate dehydratase small subunit [Cytobacillus horneckiae]PKG28348.1 3-isopropylmalate dehydratase small subunit [Cytobacillus horneckiae]